jgi:hypothetical protein
MAFPRTSSRHGGAETGVGRVSRLHRVDLGERIVDGNWAQNAIGVRIALKGLL